MIKKILIKDLFRKGNKAFLDAVDYDYNFKNLYLAFNCDLSYGSGFKKGRLLSNYEIKRLYDMNFYLIWVSDKPNFKKSDTHDSISSFREEIIALMGKYSVTFDESWGKKPGSKLECISNGDLLRRTIEPLQLDGARYIMWKIFGQSYNPIDKLQSLIAKLIDNDKIIKFDLFSHVNVIDGKENKNNYIIQSMVNILFSFIVTMNRVQLDRKSNLYEDHPEAYFPEKLLRFRFSREQLIEGSLSAFFSNYGLYHSAIYNILQQSAKSFYIENDFDRHIDKMFLHNEKYRIYSKYVNASRNLLYSIKGTSKINITGFLSDNIVKFQKTNLNHTGYPLRKLIDFNTKSEVVNMDNGIYTTPLSEMTRLVNIISFFVSMIFNTPFNLPCERDNLVRYMLLNSTFNFDESINDLNTLAPQKKIFDGFLLINFLRSINIYALDEVVPIYSIDNANKKLFDVTVISYNSMPNRPVVLSIKGNKAIDLSNKEYNSLFIGEYYPSFKFQEVIECFYNDNKIKGIEFSKYKSENYFYNKNEINSDAKKINKIIF